MEQNLENTISLLTRTPGALNALLRDLPDAWTLCNEGEKTWTAREVVGHLIHCERTDWLQRARIILQSGEAQPFPPLDREGHIREIQGKSLPQLLDEFAQERTQNLAAVEVLHLGPAQLALQGRHPALGTVTLSQLLAAWAAHDLTHLHQISRILAHQYHEAVGPWRTFLGVLHCASRSAPA